ncbi:hypothetical protein LINGRAHAP2_LOCUS16486, partial [Linum grandiflorum]
VNLKYRTCIEVARDLLRHEWAVRISHTFREGNKTVDRLAHFGLSPRPSFDISEIADCIATDAGGVSSPLDFTTGLSVGVFLKKRKPKFF